MRKEAAMAALAATATLVAIATLRNWKQKIQCQFKQSRLILRKFDRDSSTPISKLWQVANHLASEMRISPESHGTDNLLKMLVSFIGSFPSGDEEGLYYGVNLRGANFLILCARLGGKNNPISQIVHREEVSIPFSLMRGDSADLLDYVAWEVARFVSTHPDNGSEEGKKKQLGFTLSYPVDDASNSYANAIKWDNFSANDTVGKYLAWSMNQALAKHGLDLHVTTMADETIGNLAGGRYFDRDCVLAVTLGMGTNAAFIVSTQELDHGSTEMGICTEWAHFDSLNFPTTEFDVSLDRESSNPGTQAFQKLISGTYLGEIVRRVLVKMAREGALFGDSVPPNLMVPYMLRAPDMAAMHQDTSEDREIVHQKLSEIFGITDSTPMAREMVAEVCDIVAERAARLAGAGIVGIIQKLERIKTKRSVVTVEGGLYEHYRLFRNYFHSSIWEMLGRDYSDNVIIKASHGGSGAGAIFLACSHVKTQQ